MENNDKLNNSARNCKLYDRYSTTDNKLFISIEDAKLILHGAFERHVREDPFNSPCKFAQMLDIEDKFLDIISNLPKEPRA